MLDHVERDHRRNAFICKRQGLRHRRCEKRFAAAFSYELFGDDKPGHRDVDADNRATGLQIDGCSHQHAAAASEVKERAIADNWLEPAPEVVLQTFAGFEHLAGPVVHSALIPALTPGINGPYKPIERKIPTGY